MGSTSAASSQVLGGGIKPGMGVSLETARLSVDTEITGPLAAVLWVSSSSEDMDLFLTLRNYRFRRQRSHGDRPARRAGAGGEGLAAGVASRTRSRTVAAVSALSPHVRRLYLTPGEIVRVEVEIWPTSMVFKKGHRIRLDIQPRDGIGSADYMHYHADYNSGATNTIYAGGERNPICCCR